MKAALSYLVGQHDFRRLSSAKKSQNDTVREMRRAIIEEVSHVCFPMVGCWPADPNNPTLAISPEECSSGNCDAFSAVCEPVSKTEDSNDEQPSRRTKMLRITLTADKFLR
eukprot:c16954_g1_i1.p2 GENE.c16954_g1_i1~~c16954_g1_i1.p2  ORF type:complete len:111 (+),score=19.12 c16954_g1_i1:759-1091(+)